MALTTQQITDAFNAAGMDQAGLTKFLTLAKLRTELDGLNGEMANQTAKQSAVSAEIEQSKQALQQKINDKMDEINKLQPAG
jgi:hypothetical protein